MNRTFLAATLALFPLMFACQPEIDAGNPETASALEQRSGTSVDTHRDALLAAPFVTLEAVETARYQDTYYVHVETAYYATFWADRARSIPVNLGSAIQLNYQSTFYNYKYNQVVRSNLSTTLQAGGHSYYIGTGIYECDYDANGNIDHRCDETSLSLRTGVGYDTSW
ncbi:hypothetical protein SAMN05443572_103110 [Myxococcus fulvus]|uniref:Lipoprotein n=1 Tax=Myxococcus fulvus TaxID=33 RepID=A0A511TE31_MYXFU|nr:hypothetical protein [Myxococcus fulvus]GEN12425.1 hypothetical protein MFU01_74620 [Myxococcus fulvus]SET76205.1 hypothetical protein SAMN05443572_103110 [Myxococcus fulvus]